MRHWLPNKQTVLLWTSALALAVWSLPDVSSLDVFANPSGKLQHRHHAHSVIPTMAVAESTAPPTQTPSPGNAVQPGPGQPNAGQPNDNIAGQQPAQKPPAPTVPRQGQTYSPYLPYPTAKLRVRVIDGRTHEPLSGAEVVVMETEQRVTTAKNGLTSWMDVPVIRDERFRPMVAQLHGQLGVIAYKNGYRDSVHMGIRMHEGYEAETTVWMYKLGPGDNRIEPVLYQVPYHRLWLVELADRFRSKTQPGAGPERP